MTQSGSSSYFEFVAAPRKEVWTFITGLLALGDAFVIQFPDMQGMLSQI